MSTTTEDVIVDLDAAVEPKVDEIKVEVVAPETKKAPEVSPDEGLEKLKKQLADEKIRADSERDARIAAETDASEARAAEAKAKGDAQGTQLDMVKNAIASATQNKDVLKQRLRDARAAGDVDVESDIVDAMAENASNLASLKQAQKHLESAPKPEVRRAVDQVEQFASQVAANGFPRSAAWVKNHREFIVDPAKHRKMIAAHELAMADGLVADSDEYFDAIEETLKVKAAPREEVKLDDDPTADTAAAPAAKPGRQAAPASAPVARSGNGTNGTSSGSRRTMKLSPEQVEAAAISGLTVEEYAKNLDAIAKQKLN